MVVVLLVSDLGSYFGTYVAISDLGGFDSHGLHNVSAK